MSNAYKSGIMVHIRCSAWSGRLSDDLRNYGISDDLINKAIVGQPHLNLFPKEWRNKVMCKQNEIRNFAKHYGYKCPGGSIYYLPNTNVDAFNEEFNERLAKYDSECIKPLENNLDTIAVAVVEQVRQQAEAIKSANPELPTDFVDVRVAKATREFDTVKANLGKMFKVSWLPHEAMVLGVLSDTGEIDNDLLAGVSDEVKQAIFDMARMSQESVMAGHRYAWLAEIVEKLKPLREALSSTIYKINGNTIRASKEFLKKHKTKLYFDGYSDVVEKIEDLLMLLPDGDYKKAPFQELRSASNVLFDLVEMYRAGVTASVANNPIAMENIDEQVRAIEI